MKKRVRKIQDFWNRARREALNAIRQLYGLNLSETLYLKIAITEGTIETDLPDVIIAKLDTLAEDVREFFLHGCVIDASDSAYTRYVEVLEDNNRQNRHREAWIAIRDLHQALSTGTSWRPHTTAQA